MTQRTTLKIVAWDLAAGFAALGLLCVVVVVYSQNDLQRFSLAAAVLFFLAGLVRGRSAAQNHWFRGFVIALGGAVPVLVLRALAGAFTAQGYVPVFLLLSVLLAVAGLETRHLLSSRRLGRASLVALLSFAAVALAALVAIPPLMARWSSKQVNRAAPSFSLVMRDGKQVSSMDLRGRVVVLAFWASWCAPCRQELPDLEKVYEEYSGNPKVTFYAVGGPWGDDTIEKESSFAQQLKLEIPLAFDSQGAKQTLGVRSFPAVLVLDSTGHIRLIHSGYDASEHFSQHISSEIGALLGK